MALYTVQERRQLLDVPIEDILRALGRNTAHGRDGLYYSPFREEREPSFHIARDGHRWFDFGIGEGGGSVKLVCRLLGCSGADAYDFLRTVGGAPAVIPGHAGRRAERRAGGSRIVIRSISREFGDRSLVTYAGSRGIGPRTLQEFCRQVSFGFEGGARTMTAIGLENNSGGWVLRSGRTKRCSSNDITTIDIYGERSDSPTSPQGVLFEGLFDFLSWMEVSGRGLPPCDACILNSVVNLGKAAGWVAAHRQVGAFLDNDEAGRKALEELGRMAGALRDGVEINDWSILYTGFKDLNGRLSLGGSERNALTIQYQSLWNNQFQRKFRKD